MMRLPQQEGTSGTLYLAGCTVPVLALVLISMPATAVELPSACPALDLLREGLGNDTILKAKS